MRRRHRGKPSIVSTRGRVAAREGRRERERERDRDGRFSRLAVRRRMLSASRFSCFTRVIVAKARWCDRRQRCLSLRGVKVLRRYSGILAFFASRRASGVQIEAPEVRRVRVGSPTRVLSLSLSFPLPLSWVRARARAPYLILVNAV